jgi:metal-responsive CopG/Arc/MetJ family transcriptional regulator
MTTSMHRLQISLPEGQVRYLRHLSKRERVSIAEIIRRLVQDQVETANRAVETNRLYDIAGIATDPYPLIDGIAVSEWPERYLVNQAI